MAAERSGIEAPIKVEHSELSARNNLQVGNNVNSNVDNSSGKQETTQEQEQDQNQKQKQSVQLMQVFYADSQRSEQLREKHKDPETKKELEKLRLEKLKKDFSREFLKEPSPVAFRNEQIQQLEEQFSRAKYLVIHGMSGIGKTELASLYVCRVKEQKDFVIWIKADQKKSLSELVGGIIKVLGIAYQKTISMEEQIENIQEELATRKWLIVFDNVKNQVEFETTYKKLLPHLLDPTQQVLITSPSSVWRYTCFDIPLFQKPEFENYFEPLLNKKPRSTPESLEIVAEMLGRLPIALKDAFDYMINYGKSADIYYKIYQKCEVTLDKLLPTTVDNYKSLIIQLEKENPQAAELIKYCAYLNVEGIRIDLLATLLGVEEDINEYIAADCESGLLTREEKDDSVNMHCVIQNVIRYYESSKENISEQRLKHTVKVLLEQYEGSPPEDKEYLVAHMKIVRKHLESFKLKEESIWHESSSSAYKKISYALGLEKDPERLNEETLLLQAICQQKDEELERYKSSLQELKEEGIFAKGRQAEQVEAANIHSTRLQEEINRERAEKLEAVKKITEQAEKIRHKDEALRHSVEELRQERTSHTASQAEAHRKEIAASEQSEKIRQKDEALRHSVEELKQERTSHTELQAEAHRKEIAASEQSEKINTLTRERDDLAIALNARGFMARHHQEIIAGAAVLGVVVGVGTAITVAISKKK